MDNFQNIGKENWIIIFLFISISAFITKIFPHKGLEWISFFVIALLICFANVFVLSMKSNSFSNASKKFLIFRIAWSLAFSIYVILVQLDILDVYPNIGLLVVIIFYVLAIVDILVNMFSRVITTEIGPGFIPKNII